MTHSQSSTEAPRCSPEQVVSILDHREPRTQDSASPVTVCHVASGDVWGGAELQVSTLIKELARRDGVSVCAILLNEGHMAQELRHSGVQVKVIPERENSFGRIFWQATTFLKDRHIEILHAHRYKENLLALLLAWRLSVPFIVRTQHGRPERLSGIDGLKQRLFYAMDRRVTRHAADRVISVSSELAGYLRTHVDRARIRVICNGIDLSATRSTLTQADAKQRLGVPESAPLIGTIGRLERGKRLDLFLKTAALLSKRMPNARFLIAGDGRERSAVRRMVNEAGLQDCVLLLGHRDDVYDVLRAMDLMLMTSDQEGLPMTLLEAMAMEVPIVARPVGGIPEVIESGQRGMLVPSADPVALASTCAVILNDKNLYRRLTRTAHQFVSDHHSAVKNADLVLNLYRSMK